MNDKKNVAFFIPRLSGGGAERVFLNLANQISTRENVSVYMFVCKTGGPYDKLVQKQVNLVSLGEIRLGGAFFPLLRAVKENHISTLFSAMPVPNAFACLLKLLRPNINVILTEHNDIRVQLVEKGVEWRKRIVPFIVRRIYPFADRVVCVSSGVKDFVCATSSRLESKATVIYNPVFHPDIVRLSKSSVPEIFFPEDKIKLIAVGRLTPQKNVSLLIETVQRLKERGVASVLYVLGDGELKEQLNCLVMDFGVSKDVKFLGFQDNPYKYMAKADVFVLSSLWEGFGNVLVEAAGCGLKLVSTDCPSGPREVLSKLKVGSLVAENNADALADAIIFEYKHGVSADASRLEEFSIDNVSSAYFSLIS